MTSDNKNTWDLGAIADAFDKQFAEAKEPEATGKVPDGKYEAIVNEVEFRTSKAGNPMLNWKLTITSGEYAGRVLWRTNSITDNTVEFFKKDLRTCGIAITSLRELNLKDLLDLRLAVQVKEQKKEHEGDPPRQNVYINSLLGKGPVGENARKAALAGDDPNGQPLPF